MSIWPTLHTGTSYGPYFSYLTDGLSSSHFEKMGYCVRDLSSHFGIGLLRPRSFQTRNTLDVSTDDVWPTIRLTGRAYLTYYLTDGLSSSHFRYGLLHLRIRDLSRDIA
jgi:hypothetical protein